MDRYADERGLRGEQLLGWLKVGRVLLALDGVDEVPLEQGADDQRWFYVLEQSMQQGMKTANEMLRQFRMLKILDEIAANPLLLTAIRLTYSGDVWWRSHSKCIRDTTRHGRRPGSRMSRFRSLSWTPCGWFCSDVDRIDWWRVDVLPTSTVVFTLIDRLVQFFRHGDLA